MSSLEVVHLEQLLPAETSPSLPREEEEEGREGRPAETQKLGPGSYTPGAAAPAREADTHWPGGRSGGTV